MTTFIRTAQGLLVNLGESGEYPLESELVFGIATKDGAIATYPNTTNPAEPKYLLINDQYGLYSYVTKEQLVKLEFYNNKWTKLSLEVAPEITSLKGAGSTIKL